MYDLQVKTYVILNEEEYNISEKTLTTGLLAARSSKMFASSKISKYRSTQVI